MNNKANKIFILIVAASLLSGLALALIAPKEINEAENRYAEKMLPLTPSNYMSSKYQDSVEKALADQMIASEAMKEGYNSLSGKYSKFWLDWTVKTIAKTGNEIAQGDEDPEGVLTDEDEPKTTDSAIDSGNTTGAAIATESAIGENTDPEVKPEEPKQEPSVVEGPKYAYVSVGGGMYDCQGYLVSGLVYPINSTAKRLGDHIPVLNQFAEDYPELCWYIYYIEDESDASFTSLKKTGTFEYIKERLTSYNPNNVQKLNIDSFEKYSRYFYKSDHHWAYEGSYQGYKDMLTMLKPNAEPLEPLGEYKLGVFYGSFAKTNTTASYHDDICAYEFEFPEMEILSAGKAVKDYGDALSRIQKIKEGGSANNKTSYASVYGGDIGEIIFHNPSGNGSLLVFGNSYDNAVLKLLAAHYEYLYSIDMRYYKNATGHDFSFAEYYSAHPDIVQVLQLGTVEYFIQAPYIFGK